MIINITKLVLENQLLVDASSVQHSDTMMLDCGLPEFSGETDCKMNL